jgi:hypothetical protein
MRASLRHAVLALLVAACGGGARSSTDRATAPLEPEVRDSSGVTIVEYQGDAIERAPTITMEPAPTARLGQGIDSLDLSSAYLLASLSGGRVGVFEGRASALRIFGADGGLVATTGRRGEGPGEFMRVERLFRVADTLVASDGSGRVTLLDSNGEFVRSFTVPRISKPPTMYGVIGRGDSSRWFMGPEGIMAGGPPEMALRSTIAAPLGLISEGAASGTDVDSVASVLPPALVTQLVTFNGRRSEMSVMPTFGAFPYSVALPSGGVAVAQNLSWELQIVTTEGTRRILRFDRPRQAVTDSIFEAYVAGRTRQMRERRGEVPDTLLVRMEADMRSRPRLDSLPPFSGLHVGPRGTIWLLDWRSAGVGCTCAIALSPEGGLLGRLVLPDQSRIVAFTDDRIILRQEDDDGIVTFAVHRLHFP